MSHFDLLISRIRVEGASWWEDVDDKIIFKFTVQISYLGVDEKVPRKYNKLYSRADCGRAIH